MDSVVFWLMVQHIVSRILIYCVFRYSPNAAIKVSELLVSMLKQLDIKMFFKNGRIQSFSLDYRHTPQGITKA